VGPDLGAKKVVPALHLVSLCRSELDQPVATVPTLGKGLSLLFGEEVPAQLALVKNGARERAIVVAGDPKRF
jgi:hypothetical protein